MSIELGPDLTTYPLVDLAKLHLQQVGTIIEDLTLVDYKQIPKNLSFLLKVNDALLGVFVLDWKRAIGTNQLIIIEQIVRNSNLSMGLMVGNRFSLNTKGLAERTKTVTLITRAEIIEALEMDVPT